MASFIHLSVALTFFLFFLSPIKAILTDVDGEPLVNGGSYFILPLKFFGNVIEGFTPIVGTTSNPCPVHIAQRPYPFPVKISSPVKSLFLPEGVPVHIKQHYVFTNCSEPLHWWVNPKIANDPSYVLAGAPESPSLLYGFGIEHATGSESGYYLKYCFTSESNVRSECEYVGVKSQGHSGEMILFHDNPIAVTFKKNDGYKVVSSL